MFDASVLHQDTPKYISNMYLIIGVCKDSTSILGKFEAVAVVMETMKIFLRIR